MPRGNHTPESHNAFMLGDWLVDPEISRLRRDEHEVHLEIKVMDVLVHLAFRRSRVVTRQQLIDAVWDGGFVCDNTLTHAIAEIRRALGDCATNPEYIETIHRRGYRMLKLPQPVKIERRHSWSARDRIWTTAAKPDLE